MIACRRQHVTLLELLMVMAIIALVGGLVSLGINKALNDQRFRSEVSLIVDELRLAQDLMLILGTDTYVKFASEKGRDNQKGIRYWIELETKLPERFEREVLRSRANLKAIKGVFFHDPLSKPGQISVRFQSKGAVMSQGVMRLASSDEEQPRSGTLQSFICFPGYPAPIFASDEEEKAKEKCEAALGELADPKLTEETFSKINADEGSK